MGRAFVLARLVAPGEWGLMGIALLVIDLVSNFSNTGLTTALIQQKQRPGERELDTAWTIEVARGLFLSVLVFLAAPLAEWLFHTPDATALLRVMGLGVFVRGLANTAVIDFDRDLEFQRRFVYRTLPHLVEAGVAIALAFVFRNAWALAFGWLAGRATYSASSHLVHAYRPKLRFAVSEARHLLSFGRWIFGSRLLSYGLHHIDDIVVARIAGAASLGLYQMAYTMSQLAASEITNVTYTVALPAYSNIQGDPERLRRAFLRTLQFVAFLSLPLTAGIWFLGPAFVDAILGRRWKPLLPALGVLLIWGLVRAITNTADPLLHGIGRPELVTRNKAIQLAILAIAIYPFTSRWGIEGAAWATVVAATTSVWILVLATRLTAISASEVARVVGFPLLHTGVMLGVLFGIDRLRLMPSGVLVLVWAPLIGAITYFGAAAFSRRIWSYGQDGLLPAMSRGGETQ